MALEEFENTIKQAAPLARQVCLHLMGEPLAHPKFLDILKICEQYNCPVQLTTNGLLLSKHMDAILGASIVRQVNVSLQSYMDNFPDRDITPYLDKVFAFVKNAMEKRPELYLNLRLWNLAEKLDDSLNEKVYRYLEEKFSTSINRKVEVGAVKSKRVQDRLYLHFDSRFEWPRMELPVQGDQGRCNALKDHVAIHADGAVVPCCLDDQKIINLGNCHETSLKDILDSPRAKAMREGFSNGVLVEELCQRCSFINRFKKQTKKKTRK